MEGISSKFWNADMEELRNGFSFNPQSDIYTCLICGKEYEIGIIYKVQDKLMEAARAIKEHITHEHGSMFDYLIEMDKKYTGLTDHQKELVKLFRNGYSDKEIVKLTGGNSTSTIRNHRFSLREKEKQAKIFMTIMSFITESNSNEKLVSIHKSATMVDERYSTTETEKEKIIQTYFDENNMKLNSFPSREKRKIIVLQHIMRSFESDRRYTEKEINTILENIYSDYATIRRYLIEYGFMDREKDCSFYWVKE